MLERQSGDTVAPGVKSRGKRRPASRADYWETKIRRNQERDGRNVEELERQGWRVITLWECQLTAEQTHFAELLEREVLPRISQT